MPRLSTAKNTITTHRQITSTVKLRCRVFTGCLLFYKLLGIVQSCCPCGIDACQSFAPCPGCHLFAGFPVLHPCPHCRQPSFTDLQKLTSLWLQPRPCKLCHKAAYLPVRSVVEALIIWTALTWIFIGTALYMRNIMFMLGTIPAAVFAVDKWIRKAPLIAYETKN